MSVAIGVMKKVSITVFAGSGEDSNSFTPEPVGFEFIHGIGAGGLTPFELALEGRKVEDSLKFTLADGEAREFFGGFYFPLMQQCGITIFPPKLYLQVQVRDVANAEQREVVKALAASLGHGGCGGSCGCGC